MSEASQAQLQHISIHALVKRATLAHSRHNIPRQDFNPRPRKEGDMVKIWTGLERRYFNPRPRKEGDISRRATER